MAKQRRRKARRGAHPFIGSPIERDLRRAEGLLDRGEWADARDLLLSLEQRSPRREDVLEMLAEVAEALQDALLFERALERLAALQPDDPDLLAGLAGAHLLNTSPARALQALRRLEARWPERAADKEVAPLKAKLEGLVGHLLEHLGRQGEEGLEIAARHERARSLLAQGRAAEALAAAEHLLERWSDFVPALNNASQAQLLLGRTDEAIALARRVLELDPTNMHALSNLTRYLLLDGRHPEAAATAERLRATPVVASDGFVKQAEAFSFLGDDEAVLDTFEAARKARVLDPAYTGELLCHLAGVAALRLGREAEARRRWRQALKLAPGYPLSQDNLDDLELALPERHGPWPFDFASWVPNAVIRALVVEVGVKPSARTAERLRQFLGAHPNLVALLPALLDRGDPPAREFAVQLSSLASTPATLAALKDFALGQRGPDELRMQAAQTCVEAGLIEAGPVRLWVRGAWREVLLLGITVSYEPEDGYPRSIARLMERAHTLLRQGKGAAAEPLLRQALGERPDDPRLLNNLAVALTQQKRDEEARAIMEAIWARHPDYLFGRVSRARTLIEEGDLAGAQAQLEPLARLTRMHVTEFSAYCAAQVHLLSARGDPEAAESWLAFWEQVHPDDPGLEHWRLTLALGRLAKGGFLRRRRRR